MTSNSNFPPISLAPATKLTYAVTGARLANRLATAAGSTDLSDVVAQFLITGGSYSQRTFRLYKASLLHHLAEHNAPPSLLKTLIDSSSKDCERRSKSTSGRKSKTVGISDRLVLLAALRERGTATSQVAADYFEAGLIAGPRPVEWIGASLELMGHLPIDAPASATHKLTFPNAKRDSGGIRGNGDTRSMYVNLTAQDAAVITRVIANAQENRSNWAEHYDRMRSALRYTGLRLWPKRNKIPCFYSTRHQSQADAKASGRRPNEIAAMYGHASDNTNSQHYARASQGDKNMYKLSPTALSLSKVRNQRATQRVLAKAVARKSQTKET